MLLYKKFLLMTFGTTYVLGFYHGGTAAGAWHEPPTPI